MNRLLKLLSENSNYTNAELALILNEPEDYIRAQIKEYEDKGIIRGYKAIVNWQELDEDVVSAIIEVKVTPERETGFDRIAEEISNFDEVKTVNLIAGQYDLLLVVTGNTMNDVASFVSKKLSPIDNVFDCQTNFILKNYKEGGVKMVDSIEDNDKRSYVI